MTLWIVLGIWAALLGLGMWGVHRWGEAGRGGRYFNEHDHTQYE